MTMCGSEATDSQLEKIDEADMIGSGVDFAGWSDFPKGLKVLLLDDDESSAAIIKSQLERMDYIVSLFHNEDEAIETISTKKDVFHAAIVEVRACNHNENFKFLQTARNLPTIMISDSDSLSTVMRCIALGAVEFLQKPVSEEKLKNIWQHVVHKAFNAGDSAFSESLKPVKEKVASVLHLHLNTGNSDIENQYLYNVCDVQEIQDEETGKPVGNDRLPAPSTPQRSRKALSADLEECQDQLDCSINSSEVKYIKEASEPILSCSETQFADNSIDENEDHPSVPDVAAAEEEVNSITDDAADECCVPKHCSASSNLKDGKDKRDSNKKNGSIRCNGSHSYSGKVNNKKRMKVDWSPDLHRRFTNAVEQLGIDQAIPSKILEVMKVQGLTRHNVASHLQKYRMHRRHSLPKDEGRRWPQHRDHTSRFYTHKPLPGHHPFRSYQPHQTYPVWGHPAYHPSTVQLWGHTALQTWQPSHGNWPWKTYNRMQADAWGCPVPPPESPFSFDQHQNISRDRGSYFVEDHKRLPSHMYDFNLGDEVIDEVVKEAISKPWLPLPLGLKPPSTETVLAELHRKGIHNIPPPGHPPPSPPHH